MSDDVEEIRKELGEKMARDGEPLHDNASDSVREGYRRGNMGFGTNVLPRNFGRSGLPADDWECICGNINSGRVRKKIAGRIVCWECGIEQELAMKAKGV